MSVTVWLFVCSCMSLYVLHPSYQVCTHFVASIIGYQTTNLKKVEHGVSCQVTCNHVRRTVLFGGFYIRRQKLLIKWLIGEFDKLWYFVRIFCVTGFVNLVYGLNIRCNLFDCFWCNAWTLLLDTELLANVWVSV